MSKALAAIIPSDRLFFRIRDVAQILEVKPYVLRFWETEFPMVKPTKTSTGHRVYQRNDVETLLMIKALLYKERYSIEGARKRIRELKKKDAITQSNQKVENDQQVESAVKELRALVRKPLADLFTL